jgi:hypothetical protein
MRARDNSPARTEDDLRSALRSLERYAPTVDSVLRAIDEPPGRRGQARARLARWLTGRRLAVLAATAAVVTALAVTVTLLTAPGASQRTAGSLRSAILTAFNQASGDILYVRTTIGHAPGTPASGSARSRAWYAPWQPAPGQHGRTRLILLKASGAVSEDYGVAYVMAQPGIPIPPGLFPGQGISGPVVNAAPEKTPPSARVLTVNYGNRTWHRTSGHVTDPNNYATALRFEITNGRWRISRHHKVDGQQTIELMSQARAGIVLPHKREVTGQRAVRLWVNAHTYLPVRQAIFITAPARRIHPHGTGNITIYQWVSDYALLPPTAANLAKLRVPIPHGFRRVHCPPDYATRRCE